MMIANARSVNVKRTDLLAKLKENREKHAAEYTTAMDGFRIEIEKILKTSIENVFKDPSAFDEGLHIMETPPENHTDEYDLAITMMEMSTDDTIHMDSSSFNQYVMDNWSWKQNFTATSAKYISNVSVRRGE